jgi:hypothetical protein
MELLVSDWLYKTHIAVRTIERRSGMSDEDVVNAMLTNGSVSNFGGNSARRSFGGSST